MTRPRLSAPLALALAASTALLARPARADAPSTAECLHASEAALGLRARQELRAARDALVVCASASCPAEVRSECARRVDVVNESIPTVVFDAKDGAGNDVGGVRLSMDGRVLVDPLDGSAVSLDPGEHTFRFEAAGRSPVEKTFILNEHEKDRRETIVFGPGAGASVRPRATTNVVATSTRAARPEDGAPRPWQRPLGWIAAGVGVVAVATGGALGVAVIGAKSTMNDHCGGAIGAPSGRCDQEGVDAHERGVGEASAATVSMIAGALVATAGVVLIATAPSARGPAARVGVGPGSVWIHGTF